MAKFPTNPNEEFYFKTKKDASGVEFEVIKVSIGTKSLNVNKATYKDNILTYPEVLEGVDLQYHLNTNGIAKFFVIKNAAAITKNDLTSYSFDLADNSKLEKKDEKKDQFNAILNSKGASNSSLITVNKVKNGEEITATNAVKEKASLIEDLEKKTVVLESIKKEEEAKGDKKDESIVDLANQSIESANSVKEDLTKNKIDVTDTVALQTKSETLESNSSNFEKIDLVGNKNKLTISSPVVFDQNIDSVKTIQSTVVNTNDKLVISVDKKYLESKDRKYPIYIDPQLDWTKPYGDTFISRNSQGNNHYNHSVRLLAGNPGNDNTTGAVFGESYAFLGFHNLTPAGTTTVEAKIILNIWHCLNQIDQ